MNNYPEAVAKIADDYLDRVKAQLAQVPAHERDEFLREIRSHLYEAYQQSQGQDEIGRILGVLRKLGEPAEVVADRLPGAMMRAGRKRNLPLYILGGILIALFGIPLGFGGVGVLVGLLSALAGVLIAYYSTAVTFLLAGSAFVLSGLARVYEPQLWDRLLMLGYIQMDGPVGNFLEQMPPSAQGFVMVLCGSVLLACGVGMLWMGRYLLRGVRFLFGLMLDWSRRAVQGVRRRWSRTNDGGVGGREVIFGVSSGAT